MLRTQLLPGQYKDKAAHLLNRYVDLGIAIGQRNMTRQEERKGYKGITVILKKIFHTLEVERKLSRYKVRNHFVTGTYSST